MMTFQFIRSIKSAFKHKTKPSITAPNDVIRKNLLSMTAKIENSPDPEKISENQMMDHYMNVMSWAVYLLRLCVAMVPNPEEEERSFSRDKAIIVGHMVRIAKLYDGFSQNVAK